MEVNLLDSNEFYEETSKLDQVGGGQVATSLSVGSFRFLTGQLEVSHSYLISTLIYT